MGLYKRMDAFKLFQHQFHETYRKRNNISEVTDHPILDIVNKSNYMSYDFFDIWANFRYSSKFFIKV